MESAVKQQNPINTEESPRSRLRPERVANGARRAANDAVASVASLSRRMAGAAPAIVIKAATILEEELASGLGAARRIEQRFLDVEALRGQNADAVMSKFRRDAHEAVDIILDILTAATQTVGAQTGKFINVTAGAAKQRDVGSVAPDVRVAALRVPGHVAAGAAAEVSMALENASDVAIASFKLHSSDLVSASGARISASHVSFTPGTLSVGPKQSGRVTVRVEVPARTPAGNYEGLVRATQLESLRAMLTVVVR